MQNKFFKYFFGFILLLLIFVSFTISKTFLFITSIFFIIIAMIEYRNMFKTKNIYPHLFIPEIFGILSAYLFIFNPLNYTGIIFLLIFSFIISFLITIIKNKKPYFEVSMSTILAVIFIFCGLFILKIPEISDKISSLKLLLIYFTAVLSGDYFASKIGPLYKQYLLAHEISPNKTVLGSIINILSACIVCLFLINDISIYKCLLSGIIISVFSQIGDLTVSTLKRELGLKHSGNLFCDYGGIFDRMDAFLFSAPAFFYFMTII